MGYRVSIASMWVAMLLAIVAAQQPQQGATQENTQPGRLWPEDQLLRFARAVRARPDMSLISRPSITSAR